MKTTIVQKTLGEATAGDIITFCSDAAQPIPYIVLRKNDGIIIRGGYKNSIAMVNINTGALETALPSYKVTIYKRPQLILE